MLLQKAAYSCREPRCLVAHKGGWPAFFEAGTNQNIVKITQGDTWQNIRHDQLAVLLAVGRGIRPWALCSFRLGVEKALGFRCCPLPSPAGADERIAPREEPSPTQSPN